MASFSFAGDIFVIFYCTRVKMHISCMGSHLHGTVYSLKYIYIMYIHTIIYT